MLEGRREKQRQECGPETKGSAVEIPGGSSRKERVDFSCITVRLLKKKKPRKKSQQSQTVLTNSLPASGVWQLDCSKQHEELATGLLWTSGFHSFLQDTVFLF